MNRSELISQLPKNMAWAELGVFIGEFSKEIFTIASPSKLYLVDIFPDTMISGDKDGHNVRTLNLTNVPNELSSYFSNQPVEIIKSKTTDFLHRMSESDSKIDCVYIDADHSYDSVKKDLELSYNIVKENGFICGHDYHPTHFEGVFRAVNEFCAEKNLKIDMLSDDVLPTFIITKTKK
jgi:hypothetical protein